MNATDKKPEPDVFSDNEEVFQYDSIGEVIEANDELLPGSVIYGGVQHKPPPSWFLDWDDAVELMQARADDFGGEYAESLSDELTDEAKAEFNELFKAWADKHLKVTVYRVEHVREITLTVDDFVAEDLAERQA